MVNCLNTIIFKSFLNIVFTSSLHLFYGTIYTTQNIFTRHIFFINRMLCSITSDAIHVTIRAKYKKLNYNKTRLKNVKN